jgi:acrylyl-CoA reductase (NADPH)
MADEFKALILSQQDGNTVAKIEHLRDADLPAGDVLVAVEYSSLNYKDGLAVTGAGPIVRQWPMVPGIDLAGRVLASDSPDYAAGDAVVLTGWGVGEKYWGGYSQRQRVRAEWLAPLPPGLDSRRAMMIGTAGLTAMLCVMTLEEAGVTPDQGPVLVTGATGGVGSTAVAILAGLGFQVSAVSGKADAADYLRELGAAEVIGRDTMSEPPRALESQRWAGVVDAVGGVILARALAETRYGGCVAACGLAASAELHTTVMPFILRNVSLRGVDSVSCPRDRRARAWSRLAEQLPEAALGTIGRVIGLDEVPALAAEIVAGRVRGRIVVDLNA